MPPEKTWLPPGLLTVRSGPMQRTSQTRQTTSQYAIPCAIAPYVAGTDAGNVQVELFSTAWRIARARGWEPMRFIAVRIHPVLEAA